MGTLATARTAEGEWRFKRILGLWQQRVEVCPLGFDREVATFVPDWSGGGILLMVLAVRDAAAMT